jgi:hypothetical protein
LTLLERDGLRGSTAGSWFCVGTWKRARVTVEADGDGCALAVRVRARGAERDRLGSPVARVLAELAPGEEREVDLAGVEQIEAIADLHGGRGCWAVRVEAERLDPEARP